MTEKLAKEAQSGKIKGSLVTFESVKFVIDEIAEDSVVGHYEFNRKRKIAYRTQKVRLQVNDEALLTGVVIKTRFKIAYDTDKV